MGGELGAVDTGRRLGSVQLQGILGGYESHAGRLPGVLDVIVKRLEASLPIFRRTQTRPRPLLPLPSRAAREVDRIPELGGDKFGGVEVRADHSSARAGQLLRGGVELPQDVHVPVLMIEIGTNLVPAHVVDVEQSAIPERLLIEANLDAFIQVHRDAHAAQRQVGLRRPGRAWLPIANRSDTEDAADVGGAGRFPALEFIGALDKPKPAQIHGWGRLNAVKIGVIPDVVGAERANDVAAAARFEGARLFAHYLERGADAHAGQVVRNPQGGVIGGRLDVILGVEPEDYVDRTLRPQTNREDGKKRGFADNVH